MLSFAEQDAHLQKVSRTFALTIPMFPHFLTDCVANAYLLCRIADTVEDDPLCTKEQKVAWLTAFGSYCADNFRDEQQLKSLHQQGCDLVRKGAKPAELELFEELPAVVARTLSFPEVYTQIIARGVAILCLGMAESVAGRAISTLDDVDHYCYSVAGVVGETLACLFAAYDRKINKTEHITLSVSFGEGLQLTNILKDRFTDQTRNAYFLPKECFSDEQELLHYLALTQGHLEDSLSYIKTIPQRDAGIRQFCLLNIVMASATLQVILKNPQEQQAKITHQQVKKLYILCKLCAWSNWLTTWLFRSVSQGLPHEQRDPKALRAKVSHWDCDLKALIQSLTQSS